MLIEDQYGVGDYIDAEGLAGTIEEIGLFTTQMRTYDGIYVEVPNGQIWKRKRPEAKCWRSRTMAVERDYVPFGGAATPPRRPSGWRA